MQIPRTENSVDDPQKMKYRLIQNEQREVKPDHEDFDGYIEDFLIL